MTKVRTVVPANAKPGKSIIQVIHPKTGKAVRTTIPKDAVPGQMVEIEIPDDSDIPTGIKSEPAKLDLPPPVAVENPPQVSASKDSIKGSSSLPESKPKGSDTNAEMKVEQLKPETPVENVVYYQQQPQPVYVQPSVVQQPMYMQPVGVQPVYVQQPVMYQQKPNVVVVHEQKKGIDEDDFCAGMCAACACTWLLLALSGR